MIASASAVEDRPREPFLLERFDRLERVRIHPSKTNPRTHFDEAYIHGELAQSVREKGIIEPLIVRPHPKRPDDVEIVAGECRWRAATAAGLELLPCIVRDYTDEQALEIQLVENIHRKDLTALEQAAGYRALIKSNPDKHSAASIAQRIGMSEAWVWDRLKLNDLIPDAKAILEQELMTTGHAILIARLKPEDQKRVIRVDRMNGYNNSRDGLWQFNGGRFDLGKDHPAGALGKYADVKAVSVRELESWIRDHIRFDVAHAAKAAPLVFEPTLNRVSEAEAKDGRGKKVVPITFDHACPDAARTDEERTYGNTAWKKAEGKDGQPTCEHAVLGVVVAGGRGYGQTFHVCVARDKCRTHWADVVKAKEKAAKLRENGKSKQAAKVEQRSAGREEQKQRESEAREEAVRKGWTAAVPSLESAVIEKVKVLPIGKVIDRFVRRSQMNRALTAICGKRQPRTADDALRVLLLNDLISGLADTWPYHRERSAKRLKDLGVDVAAILKEHQPKPATPAKAKKAATA